MDVHEEKVSTKEKWKVNLTSVREFITMNVKLACHPWR